MIERAFGTSPWTVGVEEELVLVDAATFGPVAAAPLLERGVEGAKRELLASMVETTTGIDATPGEAFEKLVRVREELAAAAARDGHALLAAGSHPFAVPEEQDVLDVPRFAAFVEMAGPAARRQLVCGLHVHVGMPDADTCVRAHEGVVPWLPLVLALSANSPWFRGARAGFLSKRAEVLATLPRSGVPAYWASYAEWEASMERLLATGVGGPTDAWWDARVHPSLGTLELRAADQPTSPAVAGALVALMHALVLDAARSDPVPAARAEVHTNRFLAARFGPAARLLHPVERRLVAVPELYGELLERLAPVLEELDAASLLDALDPARCEAELQLAAAGPHEAAAGLVERSLASRG